MIQKLKGTYDVYGSLAKKQDYVKKLFQVVCENYNYSYIETPLIERSELFHRGVGETTDIVTQETYDFVDRGGRNNTLRPEGTAGVARSIIENKLYNTLPLKLWYMGSMFRYERPQAGRQRQFHQFGIEVLGSDGPSVDAEVISLAVQFFNEMGLKNLSVNINSVGCPTCREEYNRKLKEYLDKKVDVLCETCLERKDKNPMRVIDCKNPHCKENLQDIPFMIDHLCEDCKDQITNLLKRNGYKLCS